LGDWRSSTELLLILRKMTMMQTGIPLTGLGWFGAAAHWRFLFFSVFFFFSFFLFFVSCPFEL
jgi:hypothetical protein